MNYTEGIAKFKKAVSDVMEATRYLTSDPINDHGVSEEANLLNIMNWLIERGDIDSLVGKDFQTFVRDKLYIANHNGINPENDKEIVNEIMTYTWIPKLLTPEEKRNSIRIYTECFDDIMNGRTSFVPRHNEDAHKHACNLTIEKLDHMRLADEIDDAMLEEEITRVCDHWYGTIPHTAVVVPQIRRKYQCCPPTVASPYPDHNFPTAIFDPFTGCNSHISPSHFVSTSVYSPSGSSPPSSPPSGCSSPVIESVILTRGVIAEVIECYKRKIVRYVNPSAAQCFNVENQAVVRVRGQLLDAVASGFISTENALSERVNLDLWFDDRKLKYTNPDTVDPLWTFQ